MSTATTTKAKTATPVTDLEVAPVTPTKKLRFPVLAGVQAGRQNYTAMIPLNRLSDLFPQLTLFPSQKDIPLQERYQRDLDPVRAKSIARYVRNGMREGESYVLGAVSASIEVDAPEYKERFSGAGVLEFDSSAVFRLRDGQHRIRGLILAVEHDPSIGNETIPVVLYHFVSIEDEQQAWSDQNRLVRPAPKSLTLAFNWRDENVTRTRGILANLDALRSMIDFDHAKVRKTSVLVFSLQEFHRANQILLGDFSEDSSADRFAEHFWKVVVENVYDKIRPGRAMHAQTARETLISPTTLALEAIAMQGAMLRASNPKPAAITKALKPLLEFDWRKSNPLIEVCTVDGRIVRNPKAIEALRQLIFERDDF